MLGGSSIVRGEGQGAIVERLYREVRTTAIPGGSEEVLMSQVGVMQHTPCRLIERPSFAFRISFALSHSVHDAISHSLSALQLNMLLYWITLHFAPQSQLGKSIYKKARNVLNPTPTSKL